MATHSFLKKLTEPLSPRLEAWVRRVFGVGQAMLAIALAALTVNLVLFIVRENAVAARTGSYPPDPHSFGSLAVVWFLIPATVLLAFGSASVWRKWPVPPWQPLLAMVVLSSAVWRLLSR